MKKFFDASAHWLLLAILVGLVSACGGGNAATNPPPPTAAPVVSTSAPAVATSAPATATTAPTTVPVATAASAAPTPAPSGGTGAGSSTTAAPPGNLPEDLANAVTKTKDVKAARYDITSNVSFTENGQLKNQPGISGKGESNGTDSHMALTGITDQTGQSQSFEFIQAGGDTYVKGGLGIPGLDANSWYKFPRTGGDVTKGAPTATSLLSGLDPEDFRPGNFTATGIEVLDLQPCRVWSSTSTKLGEDFSSGSGNEIADRQLKAVDKADFKVWTCADGYLHQIKGHIEGHDPDVATDKATMDLTLHVYDFGSNIAINPPAGAKNFEIPGLNVTPTP